MIRNGLWVGGLLCTLGLGGCFIPYMMIRGTTQSLQLASNPQGATASVSSGSSCQTPCQLDLGDVRFAVGIERAANSHLSGFLSIVNPALGTIELNIVGAQRGDQDRHRAIAGELAEAALGLEHTGGGPAQHHGAALPASDPASDLAHPAEQVLDQVGRGQNALEVLGQLQARVSSSPSRSEAAAPGC